MLFLPNECAPSCNYRTTGPDPLISNSPGLSGFVRDGVEVYKTRQNAVGSSGCFVPENSQKGRDRVTTYYRSLIAQI
jgi:hypothetical protein